MSLGMNKLLNQRVTHFSPAERAAVCGGLRLLIGRYDARIQVAERFNHIEVAKHCRDLRRECVELLREFEFPTLNKAEV